MTKLQLVKSLEKYPDSMEVFIGPRLTEFHFGLLNSVRSEEITFMQEPFDTEEDDELGRPKIECITLHEE